VAAISITEPTKFFKTPQSVCTNKSEAKSMSVENSLFGFRGNSILVVYLCDFFKQTLGSRPSRFSFFGYEPGSGPSPILAGFEQPSLREGRGQWNKQHDPFPTSHCLPTRRLLASVCYSSRVSAVSALETE